MMYNLPLPATAAQFDIVASSQGSTARSMHLDTMLEGVLDEVIAEVPDPYRTAEWFRRPNGDSVTLVVPSSVPKAWVAADLVRMIRIALRRRNQHLNKRGRLRVRMAVDHGDILVGQTHVGGQAVRRSARLCDAAPLRAAMAVADHEDLMLVLSDSFYRDVVVEADRDLDPDAFERFEVPVKDGVEVGWVERPTRSASKPTAEAASDSSARSESGSGSAPKTVIGSMTQTATEITNKF